MERATAILLYDEGCGFCRWSAAKIVAWDRPGRLRVVALGDPEADELLAAIPRDDRRASWHLLAPNGRVYSAGAAVPRLAELLPFGTPIRILADALPAETERAYRLVSDHRERLARLVGQRACAVDPRRADERRPT